METTREPQVAIGTLKAGYGHKRAAIAIQKALEKIDIQTQMIDIGDETYPLATRLFTKFQSFFLDIFYRHLPEFFLGYTRDNTYSGMQHYSAFARYLDNGSFDRQLVPTIKVVVASHMTIADLTRKPAVLLGLDDGAPSLYNTSNPHAITVVPTEHMAESLQEMRKRETLVTGPIVAAQIVAARKRFATRLKELQKGAGLRITIATGGSLTHGTEIMGLVEAYAREMQINPACNKRIETLFVVIGSSDTWYRGGNMLAQFNRLMKELILPAEIRAKLQLIYNPNPLKLIEAEDDALGLSDIIHAKTGELVYDVAGGKVFETFANHPSLAAQEETLRKYVEEKARTGDICALEQGLPNYIDEVSKILWQLENGILFKRMQAGLHVPADGADITANMIRDKLTILQAKK